MGLLFARLAQIAPRVRVTSPGAVCPASAAPASRPGRRCAEPARGGAACSGLTAPVGARPCDDLSDLARGLERLMGDRLRVPGRRCAASRPRSAGARDAARASGRARGRRPWRSRRSGLPRSAASSAPSSIRLPRDDVDQIGGRLHPAELLGADQVLGPRGRTASTRRSRSSASSVPRSVWRELRLDHLDVGSSTSTRMPSATAELGEARADVAVADDPERAAAQLAAHARGGRPPAR